MTEQAPYPSSKVVRDELQRISCLYSGLASTGCTARFCQAGRMVHTDESCVGQNRSLQVIQQEASGFLYQMKRGGLFPDDSAFLLRLNAVLSEIARNAVEDEIATSKPPDAPIENIEKHLGKVGGLWRQTLRELEFGVQAAWKHSRKCIMRSEYKTLRVRDFRHITTSQEMGATLVDALGVAFNQGDIIPTVFMFPPRYPGRLGPQIWNRNLLAFAGYRQNDGTILGDPANVELTSDIIDLGWDPPSLKTRWDILPLVTMADGDKPHITPIPTATFPLVRIRHPQLPQIDTLGLRWVPAPALSRLGFDIGGVQYTAAPFLGWFMDAEIGVRNLTDRDRYNCLPQIIERLYLVGTGTSLGDLPEPEQLRLMSRAQAELNYAAHLSFRRDQIRIVDSLTASSQFCQFDDQHLQENGFRLPSDPYWLAPPQGSIIPIWHRGGSPNYQPRPMICKNLRDPVKAWKHTQRHLLIRDGNGSDKPNEANGCIHIPLSQSQTRPKSLEKRLFVYYSSSGCVALRLARRILSLGIAILSKQGFKLHNATDPKPLNQLDMSAIGTDDVVLLIVSSCGRGDVPANGQKFMTTVSEAKSKGTAIPGRFAIFGNGDSTYAQTFNGAARKIYNQLQAVGAALIHDGYFPGDVATQNPPWSQLAEWWNIVAGMLSGREEIITFESRSREESILVKPAELSRSYPLRARVLRRKTTAGLIQTVSLEIRNSDCPTSGNVSLLVPNPKDRVKRVMKALDIAKDELIEHSGRLTYSDFLTEFVDLGEPFSSIAWAREINLSQEDSKHLMSFPVVDSLLASTLYRKNVDKRTLCCSMTLARPRIYSIASHYSAQGCTILDLLVQTHPGGKFSDLYLKSKSMKQKVRCRVTAYPPSWLKLASDINSPLIAFATGSGVAPLQSFLQHRIEASCESERPESDLNMAFPARVGVFIGFRPSDADVIFDSVKTASKCGVIDVLALTPSNARKIRAQDKVFDEAIADLIIEKIRNGGSVIACGNAPAVDGFAQNLAALMGCNVKEALAERYIEQIFDPSNPELKDNYFESN